MNMLSDVLMLSAPMYDNSKWKLIQFVCQFMSPGLIQRLGAHCRVNLSFGLHRGWAIEARLEALIYLD